MTATKYVFIHAEKITDMSNYSMGGTLEKGQLVRYIKKTHYVLSSMPEEGMLGVVVEIGVPWSGRYQELKYHGVDIRRIKVHEIYWFSLQNCIPVPERNLNVCS